MYAPGVWQLSADAANGFNAVVKTQGPNVHPHEEHGEQLVDHHGHPYSNKHNSNSRNDYSLNYAHPALTYSSDDKSSQSKINHYSKGQEHIVLSSDLKQNDYLQDPIDLARTVKKIPQLIELRPELAKKTHNRKPTFSYDIDHEYLPHKHNPYGEESGNSEYDFVRQEYRPATPDSVSPHRHQYVNYVPGSENDWRPKKQNSSPYSAPPVVKYAKPYNNFYAPTKPHIYPIKSPLVSPGLKHYASNKPNQPRPEYNSYFRGSAQSVNRPRNEGPVVFPPQDYETTQEQRQASSQIVESMVRGNDQLFIVPIYANNHHHGRFRPNH